MKAMILAAGLGTRLKPLTDDKPKALVEVNGIPMIDIAMEKLARAGFNKIIVNVHHFADLVISHLEKSRKPDVDIEISDEKEFLLDTGGAILHAKWFLEGNEPFLVHNVDVISDIDLYAMVNSHRIKRPLATLAVSERKSSRYILFDQQNRLRGWENLLTRESIILPGQTGNLIRMAFSGIHIISPEIFELLDETGRFPIIPAYLSLAETHQVLAYPHDPGSWFDLGNADSILKAEAYLK